MSARVLIADGDAARGRAISEACGQRGMAPRLTTHGAAALEIALGEVPDALVCQLQLPLIDGAKLGAILRANPRTQGMRMIFLGEHELAGSGRELSGPVLVPPFDAKRVVDLIEEQLSGQRGAAGAASAPTDQSSVEGDLAELSLVDLLQLFHVSRKTGTVEVSHHLGRNRRQIGRITLRSGDVIHAKVGSVEGDKAFFRLLGWDRGSFAFKPEPVTGAVTIQTPTRALLREGERQRAEWGRLAIDLPPLSASVTLKVPRSALPNVIHPLTQEVLVVLDLYSRVQDVVDHCSFPDYQVLRTLHTLIQRDMVELRFQAEEAEVAHEVRLFSSARAARLREWLELDRPGTPASRDAKLLVVGSDSGAIRDFTQLLRRLPGVELDPELLQKGVSESDLANLGRVVVDSDVGIELIHLPAAERFAPIWSVAAHGALATLLLLSAPVTQSMQHVRSIGRSLAVRPQSRVYHLLLLEKGQKVSPEDLRQNLSIVDDGSLFLIPIENPEKAGLLLREMFGRILP